MSSSQPESRAPRALRRSLAFILSVGVVIVVAVVMTALVRTVGRSAATKPPTAGGTPSIGGQS